MSYKEFGKYGEDIAVKYLKSKRYLILDRNFSEKWAAGPQKGEIDIIARKDGSICFVEVKTSKYQTGRESGFSPEDRVDFKKQRKIVKLAQDWLEKNKISLESKWQIDVVSVKIDTQIKRAKIRHFKNVASV